MIGKVEVLLMRPLQRGPARRITTLHAFALLLGLEPVHRGGEAEDAEVAARGLLVAGGDGPPLLEPAPEPLDQAAVVVDVVGAGHGRLVAPGRDRGPRALARDEIAEGVRAVAAVAHDPQRHAREPVEEPRR